MQGLANQFKTIQTAFPASAKTVTGQRVSGLLGKMGAATGIGTSPEQTAFAKTQKMKARSLIKKFEGGRLTDQDIEQAASAMVDFGLTEDERKAVVYDLATQIAVVKGIDPNIVASYLEQEIGSVGTPNTPSLASSIGKTRSGNTFKKVN